MNKIPAFTVLEMLINLAVMGIILSLIYFAYHSFSQQVYGYQEAMNNEQQLHRFYQQMRKDFYLTHKIIQEEEGSFTLLFYNNQMINYSFTGGILIRKQQSSEDVIEVIEMNTSKVSRISDDAEILIDAVQVKTALHQEPMVFSIIKNYPSNISLEL